MKPYRLTLFITLFLLIFSIPGFTYSEVTHEKLNKKAVNISVLVTNDYLNNQLGFSDGIEEKINKKKVWEWVRDGGKTEDESFRYKNHFHNPLEEDWNKAGLSDVFSGTSSIIWAQDIDQGWSWKNARDYYYLALTSKTKEKRDENFAKTFRALGQVMHLIEDSAVPAHSRNDAHVLYNYEDWVKGANLDSFLTNPILFDKKILNRPPNSLAPIPIARIVDTDIYDGTNPGVGVGSMIGLSEYANMNFLSRDTIFTDDFPHPKFENTNYKDLATEVAEDGGVDKVRYISGYGVDYLAGVTLSRRMVKKLKEDGADDIDPDLWLKEGFSNKYDKCYKSYAKLLVPRAVGYSAGLLNYFFRGKFKVEMERIEGTFPLKYELTITNKSGEKMEGGTLALYYMTEEEEWFKVSDFASSYGGTLEHNGEVTAEFTMPKDIGSYALVFRGKLGQEEDAVIGKVIELPPMMTYLIEVNPPYAGVGAPPTPNLTYHAHFGTLSLSLIDINITEWTRHGFIGYRADDVRHITYSYQVYLTPDNPTIPPSSFVQTITFTELRWPVSPTITGSLVGGSGEFVPGEFTLTADGMHSLEQYADSQPIYVKKIYVDNQLSGRWRYTVPPAGSMIYGWGWAQRPVLEVGTYSGASIWYDWHNGYPDHRTLKGFGPKDTIWCHDAPGAGCQ